MTVTRDILGVLRHTQGLFQSIAEPLSADQLRMNSYDPDWIVASLLSHLGSQAEIMTAVVNASVKGDVAPGRELFEPVWDRWNGKSPEEQRDDSIASTAAHLALLEGLTDDQLDAIEISFFGDIDGVEFLRIRLSEFAVHTWDLAVTFEPTATINAPSVPALLDEVERVAGRYKFGGSPFELQVRTTEPERAFTLNFGENVEVVDGPGQTSNVLQLPAESFIRLIFGRLDETHTPSSVMVEGDTRLEELRGVFVGF